MGKGQNMYLQPLQLSERGEYHLSVAFPVREAVP